MLRKAIARWREYRHGKLLFDTAQTEGIFASYGWPLDHGLDLALDHARRWLDDLRCYRLP